MPFGIKSRHEEKAVEVRIKSVTPQDDQKFHGSPELEKVFIVEVDGNTKDAARILDRKIKDNMGEAAHSVGAAEPLIANSVRIRVHDAALVPHVEGVLNALKDKALSSRDDSYQCIS